MCLHTAWSSRRYSSRFTLWRLKYRLNMFRFYTMHGAVNLSYSCSFKSWWSKCCSKMCLHTAWCSKFENNLVPFHCGGQDIALICLPVVILKLDVFQVYPVFLHSFKQKYFHCSLTFKVSWLLLTKIWLFSLPDAIDLMLLLPNTT